MFLSSLLSMFVSLSTVVVFSVGVAFVVSSSSVVVVSSIVVSYIGVLEGIIGYSAKHPSVKII